MKSTKKLKLLLVILICIAIILIGFVGIYVKKANKYSNKIPDYKLASDLKGTTIIELSVDDSTDTVYYDSEGKKVESTEITEENEAQYTSKEEKVNPDENLTQKNYETMLKIVEERLKFLKTDQYKLDLDKDTGMIVLTYEDDYPDDIKSIIPMEGKLEIIDSNTSDVLLDNSHVKSAEATYASTEQGYSVYLTLKLNDSGLEKINNIEGYKNSTNDNGEVETNNFTVQFDTDELVETSYNDMVLTGKTLRITLGSDLTNTSTVNSKLNTATVVSKLVNIGKTPIVYNISAEEYIKSDKIETFKIMVIVSIILLVIVSVYLIVKYRVNGLLAVIAMATNASILTILIRLTNITISLNSFAAVVGLIILNTYLVSNILKEIKNNSSETVLGNVKNAYIKIIDIAIITLILFVVFAFSNMTVINSMGLLFFWGWLIVMLGNLLFTTTLLNIRNSK